MDQPTFADLEYQGKKRKTRRELFLERMEGLIPWQRLEDRIRPFYPKPGRGRHPYPLSVMLRTHCVQLFYNLSGHGRPALRVRPGQALRGVEALRPPARRDHHPQLPPPPGLGPGLNAHLESQGLKLREGTATSQTRTREPVALLKAHSCWDVG